MLEIKTCPSCGSARIKRVRRDWTGKLRDQTYNVPNLEFFACPDCGEKVYDGAAMRRIESYSPAYAGHRRGKRVG
ncbi:MAG: YgiT-type zinc finger protein [Planctomycetota bacterium]